MSDDRTLQAGFAYSVMVDDILDGIAAGRLTVGQRISSEAKLKEQYGISVTSIKRGLGLLVDQGVLRRQRGSGTFVAKTGGVEADDLVRRDTIALVRSLEHWSYHPFYTEQYRGVLAGLAKHGWRVSEFEGQARRKSGDAVVSYRHNSASALRDDLRAHPEIAGVVCLQVPQEILSSIADSDLVFASTSLGSPPYVSYDWQAEEERMFRIALREGARDLAVVSTQAEDRLRAACQRAARAMGLTPDEVSMTLLPCAETRQGTELIRQAYTVTQAAFAKPTTFDGMVVTGDFELQGVTDALVRLPIARWRPIRLVAFINRETKLHTPLPMIAIMADGRACGIALAEMMHDIVTSAGGRFRRITMACDEVEID